MPEDAGLFIKLYIDEDVTYELAVALRDRGFEAESASDADRSTQTMLSSWPTRQRTRWCC